MAVSGPDEIKGHIGLPNKGYHELKFYLCVSACF